MLVVGAFALFHHPIVVGVRLALELLGHVHAIAWVIGLLRESSEHPRDGMLMTGIWSLLNSPTGHTVIMLLGLSLILVAFVPSLRRRQPAALAIERRESPTSELIAAAKLLIAEIVRNKALTGRATALVERVHLDRTIDLLERRQVSATLLESLYELRKRTKDQESLASYPAQTVAPQHKNYYVPAADAAIGALGEFLRQAEPATVQSSEATTPPATRGGTAVSPSDTTGAICDQLQAFLDEGIAIRNDILTGKFASASTAFGLGETRAYVVVISWVKKMRDYLAMTIPFEVKNFGGNEGASAVHTLQSHVDALTKIRDRMRRAAAMMAAILKVYDCGKAKDTYGKLRNWTLKENAEQAVFHQGVEGLKSYYERCLYMKDARAEFVKDTLKTYGCPTLESVREEFADAYLHE